MIIIYYHLLLSTWKSNRDQADDESDEAKGGGKNNQDLHRAKVEETSCPAEGEKLHKYLRKNYKNLANLYIISS